jgi:hypothetical protein
MRIRDGTVKIGWCYVYAKRQEVYLIKVWCFHAMKHYCHVIFLITVNFVIVAENAINIRC